MWLLSWNKCIKIYLAGVRQRDRELGLMTSLHVFDSTSNIACTSSHLCLFYYKKITFKTQTSYFRQISLNICCWNHKAMASTKQKDDDIMQLKRYATRTVLGLVKRIYYGSLFKIFIVDHMKKDFDKIPATCDVQ